MRIIVGLTGPTGAGKSTVSEFSGKSGIQVIDCDSVARKAVEKGSDGLAALVSAFGSGILNHDGSLDRKALAKAAFSSPENTELLNKTVLPYISDMIKSMMQGERILLDAPTLFESGLNSICNKTVAVLAEKNVRLKRIMARDNIDKEAALLRMNAGKSDEFYINNADRCFYNNGTPSELIEEISPYFDGIFERN